MRDGEREGQREGGTEGGREEERGRRGEGDMIPAPWEEGQRIQPFGPFKGKRAKYV